MDFLVYSVCFGAGLLFAVVSALLGHLFGGHDVDADVGTGGHAEAGFQDAGVPGLSPFSPTTITAFITAFGGLGMIFARVEATRSPWVSAPLALLGALAIAAGVVWLFGTIFHKVDASSESRVATLVGMSATVITPIPAGGVGEIAYVQAGSRYTAPARTESGVPVASGQAVKIVRIVGTQFYVAPL
ncbi:MAG TPA: NfeD family protein [Verrucomicrobiota bacterium]|nr:NfeD family protein [Verrucomicrobiota bacterium]